MRRSLAFAFALAVVGFAPVAPVLGFCAQQPCCAPADSTSIESSASCCGELACERETDKANAKAQLIAPAALSISAAPVVLIGRPAGQRHSVTEIAALSERLASLSTLRI